MWEEHPAYQKAQAAGIGIGLVLLLLAGVVYCVSERDWRLLAQVLLIAGSGVFCLALLSFAARLLVMGFSRRKEKRER